MKDEFSIGNLVHDGNHYDCENTFDIDIPFYSKWCKKAAGPVLELCCGTGRLTIPLSEQGVDITGFDISDSMLEKAKKKASDLKVNRPSFINGDMRNFNFDKKFKLIFIPFNSLQCIYTIEDVETIFSNVKKSLDNRGYFIFDIFNPSIHLMVEREKEYQEMSRYKMDNGDQVIVSEKCFYDSANQVNRVKWLYDINGEKIINNLDMRCFYPLEMDVLLKYNGFKVLHKFGDFNEDCFSSKSAKQIYVCSLI